MNEIWSTLKGDEWSFQTVGIEAEGILSSGLSFTIQSLKIKKNDQFLDFLIATRNKFKDENLFIELDKDVEQKLDLLVKSQHISTTIIKGGFSRRAKVKSIKQNS